MSHRPRSVTLVSYLFIAAGLIGLGYHGLELSARRPLQVDLVWVLFVRLLAVVGGLFVLRGDDWARWLLLAWLAYHVVLGALHSPSEAAAHAVLLAGVAYVLLRAPASAYFRSGRGRAEAGFEVGE